MAQKTIQGNQVLARQIRSRRSELGLTIEEASSRAGVGTKTWCRYEAGGSIRIDKCKGICRALNWIVFPESDAETYETISVQEYKTHEAWSPFLENTYGTRAAMAFAAGSDILSDHINEDLAELVSMPAGSHLGQPYCKCVFDLLSKIAISIMLCITRECFQVITQIMLMLMVYTNSHLQQILVHQE